MYNNWFTIGPLTIHGYGAMIAVGILAAFWLAEKQAKKHGLDADNIDSFVFFVIIIGFICAKLLYALTVFDQLIADPLSVLGSGGWVVYGGVLGGIGAAYYYCKHHGWNFADVFNVLIPCIPLAQGFGRIGCFFAGCCYGKPTDAWFGVTFPADSLCPTGSAVIPTQLIMSAGDFIIFAIVYRHLEKGKHPETTAALYLILYSVGRFAVEFLRGDANRGFVGILSTSQFISLFAFAFGLFVYYRSVHQNDQKESTQV